MYTHRCRSARVIHRGWIYVHRSGTSVKKTTSSNKLSNARDFFTDTVAPVNTDVSNAVSVISQAYCESYSPR